MRSCNHKAPTAYKSEVKNGKVHKLEKKSDKNNARIISRAHAHFHAMEKKKKKKKKKKTNKKKKKKQDVQSFQPIGTKLYEELCWREVPTVYILSVKMTKFTI